MLWKELHHRALTFRGHNDSSFIVDFSEKIPQFLSGCKCHEFFNKYVYQKRQIICIALTAYMYNCTYKK